MRSRPIDSTTGAPDIGRISRLASQENRDTDKMTSKAYCFFCFESLSASFENRKPATLEQIVQQCEEYTAETTARKDDAATDEELTEDEEDEEEGEEENTTTAVGSNPTLPSISRLQDGDRNSSSSRSSITTASTPSMLSANSSQLALPSSSSTTTSSTSIEPTNPTTNTNTKPIPSITASYPLFVTWNVLSRSTPPSKTLRGCIGTFDPLPLPTGLASYALTSAFDDTRFSPIPSSLLPSLSCSLTLLADFEPAKDALDWTLGTHGLRISFTYKGRRMGATYLPDVAVEQGWGRVECVESLMRKAGWDGGSSRAGGGLSRRILRAGGSGGSEGGSTAEVKRQPWESDGVSEFKTVRYTGLKSSADYEEWDRFRRWVDAR